MFITSGSMTMSQIIFGLLVTALSYQACFIAIQLKKKTNVKEILKLSTLINFKVR